MQDATHTVQQALAAERAAWSVVRDRPPGSLGHDPVLWQAWLVAAERLAMVPLPTRHQPPAERA